jgi:pimeloyl-ACP methyl ester carboxylesterase
VVRGYRWRGDATSVLLLHAPGEDLDAWEDLPGVLAGDGYSIVAVDLPGHGLSDDPWEPLAVADLISVLIAEARAAGARRSFVVAAGELAPAALLARDVDACVAVSPAAPETAPDGPTPPVLVLVGGLDRGAVEAADRFFRWTRGWAVMSALGTERQGAAIFTSDWGGHAREQMLGFFRDYRVADER